MSDVIDGGGDGFGCDGPGDGRHPPEALREAGLSVRERGGAARVGRAQLLGGEPDALCDAAPRGDRGGAGRDAALPGVQGGSGGSSGGGPGRADRGAPAESPSPFSASNALYEGLVDFLREAQAAGLTHDELEGRVDVDGRELCRQLLQDHLDLRASREVRAGAVSDTEGIVHRAAEAGHRRDLETIFGEVTVTRIAYRAKGAANLHLQDAALNLPAGRHAARYLNGVIPQAA